MKICKDTNCKRLGQKLSLSEFPRDPRAADGRYAYCKECCRRRSRAIRAAKGARKRTFKRSLVIERKPMVLSLNPMAFSQVYEAVNNGCRTREAIRRETKLGYDQIGEALCELLWECKAIRIQEREFHLAA